MGGGSYVTVTSSAASSSGGRLLGLTMIRAANSRMETIRTAPSDRRTQPSANSRSWDGISVRREAIRNSLSRSSCEAVMTAPPPVTALRLAHVPQPRGVACVSPCTTATSSTATPSASATSWAYMV